MQNSGRPKCLSKGAIKILNKNSGEEESNSELENLMPVMQILSIKGKAIL